MAGYIRVRRCDVSQDSFERTKGLAMEQAQDDHTQMLVCKVVGIVKTQEPVYEPLEQSGRKVRATVNYVDPKLEERAKRAAEYVERITKLLDFINANEPQEGGEA
jgi:hypothetical protein